MVGVLDGVPLPLGLPDGDLLPLGVRVFVLVLEKEGKLMLGVIVCNVKKVMKTRGCERVRRCWERVVWNHAQITMTMRATEISAAIKRDLMYMYVPPTGVTVGDELMVRVDVRVTERVSVGVTLFVGVLLGVGVGVVMVPVADGVQLGLELRVRVRDALAVLETSGVSAGVGWGGVQLQRMVKYLPGVGSCAADITTVKRLNAEIGEFTAATSGISTRLRSPHCHEGPSPALSLLAMQLSR